jgi:hypothetical protein
MKTSHLKYLLIDLAQCFKDLDPQEIESFACLEVVEGSDNDVFDVVPGEFLRPVAISMDASGALKIEAQVCLFGGNTFDPSDAAREFPVFVMSPSMLQDVCPDLYEPLSEFVRRWGDQDNELIGLDDLARELIDRLESKPALRETFADALDMTDDYTKRKAAETQSEQDDVYSGLEDESLI